MDLQQIITAKLEGAFAGDKIELTDEKHDGSHWHVSIVSSKFEGMNRLERSRMIYDLLDEFMKDDHIHALRMTLKTQAEV